MSTFKFEDRRCGDCGTTWSALTFWPDDAVCGQCSRRDYERRLAEINEGRPYTVDSIGGMCPTQAQGTWVDGRQFYFRARHGAWTLQAGWGDGVGGEYIGDGEDPSGGCMEWEAVLAILDEYAEAIS